MSVDFGTTSADHSKHYAGFPQAPHATIDRLLCYCVFMDTRITVDLRDPQLLKLLRLEAAQEGKTIREIITIALEAYFSSRRENQAILKLAEQAFAEWDNPRDSDYDRV